MVSLEHRRNGQRPLANTAGGKLPTGNMPTPEQIIAATKKTLSLNPVATIAAGLIVGIAIGWIIKR